MGFVRARGAACGGRAQARVHRRRARDRKDVAFVGAGSVRMMRDVGAEPAQEATARTTSRLLAAFRDWSPRLNPRPTPLAGVALYAAVLGLFAAGLARAFLGSGLSAWS